MMEDEAKRSQRKTCAVSAHHREICYLEGFSLPSTVDSMVALGLARFGEA